MLENSTTVRAETVERAIKIGLTKLGITEAEAKINVISEGKKGIFGFGKQDAIVEISTESDLSMAELTTQLEKEVKAAEAAKDERQIPKTPQAVKANNHSPKKAEVNSKPQPQAKAPAKPETPKAVAPTKPGTDKVKTETKVTPKPAVKKAEIESKEEAISKETVDIQEVESVDKVELENSQKKRAEVNKEARLIVVNYLEDVLKTYGADATVTYEEKGNQVVFNIETNKSGLVIGKHGKIINALQTLSQILLHRYDRRRVSVILNVGDYRDRRSNVLEQIAQRTADQVLRSKQAVILDPLPAYERKQIHAYLSRIDHIKTHSEGKDPNRYLVVEYVN